MHTAKPRVRRVTFTRLRLALHALLPIRVPTQDRSCTDYGFVLRLPDGPALANDDPLLAAFAAEIVSLTDSDEHDEGLQHESFDPGRPVCLRHEGLDDEGDALVGVWDPDGVRRAGGLPYRAALRVAAGAEHGLQTEGIVLAEQRVAPDDRRSSLDVLVYAPSLVDIEAPTSPALRPSRRGRARLVLVAHATAGLQWWDPSGERAPADVRSVSVSEDLAAGLERLQAAYARLAEMEGQVSGDAAEAMGVEFIRDELQARTRALWARVRAELAREYAVGLLLPGMRRPAWSPADIPDEEDDWEPVG